jgi:hypothetical protein
MAFSVQLLTMILKIEDLFFDSWLGQVTLSRLQTSSTASNNHPASYPVSTEGLMLG